MIHFVKTLLIIFLMIPSLSDICSAGETNSSALQENSISLIKHHMNSITDLPVECVLLENEGEFENNHTSTLWAIREKHDQTCGGDPDTAPIISRVVSIKKPDQEGIELFRLDIECMCLGDKLNLSNMRTGKSN